MWEAFGSLPAPQRKLPNYLSIDYVYWWCLISGMTRQSCNQDSMLRKSNFDICCFQVMIIPNMFFKTDESLIACCAHAKTRY
jgi:hypothetical protein